MLAALLAAFPALAERTRGQQLLLGVDRMDYTKGVPHRLRIVEALLDGHPELRGRVTFVQVGAPTRSVIPRYAALADEDLFVDRANSVSFTSAVIWRSPER